MSENEYVPTTGDIRRWVEYRGPGEGAVFDRWLAAHDQKVKAAVLREMAEDWMHSDPVSHRFRNWLRDTADRIESEARP